MVNVEDPLEAVLLNMDVDDDAERVECVSALHGMGLYSYEPRKLSLDLENHKTPPTKPSIEEPSVLELKPLPPHLRYEYLGPNFTLPIILSSCLTNVQVDATLAVLQKCERAIRWTLVDIQCISPAFCMHKIILEEDARPSPEHQRRLNEAMQEVVKKEVIKWLDDGVVYPISDSSCTSLVQCVLKKGRMTVVTNANNELIPTRTVTGWRVCMDYRKLNKVTRKDHFPLSFLDQMLHYLAGRSFYCFLDGYSGYNQILIAPEDQEKTTFTCPYDTFAFSRMPFGLCNAPATFQQCMMAIFTDMVEDILEVFMDDFSVVGESFEECLTNWDQFDLEIMDRKGRENQVADHLYRLEAEGRASDGLEINDAFPDKQLLVVSIHDMSWFADVANYLVTGIIPYELSSNQRKKLKWDSLDYYWDEPYLFKNFTNGVIRRCVPEEEQLNAGDFVRRCDECQRAAGISKKDEMPLNTILEVDIFGTPHSIISDGGSHFCNRAFDSLLAKYGIRIFEQMVCEMLQEL
ncbi:uncharacterized protein [Nicotiana sylvestris]|uniref:uncharacterized protein n=1 Tax=Nicotiana sylvestris TaxID=4096 RepID=UPI00388C3B2A